MKTLVIIILVLLVIGLYYHTDETKEIMEKTGFVVKEEVDQVKDDVKTLVKEKIVDKKES